MDNLQDLFSVELNKFEVGTITLLLTREREKALQDGDYYSASVYEKMLHTIQMYATAYSK